MDGVLRARTRSARKIPRHVSILVLMDGVLRDGRQSITSLHNGCFNPCSNGWCTSSILGAISEWPDAGVSILVLMDGVLRA